MVDFRSILVERMEYKDSILYLYCKTFYKVLGSDYYNKYDYNVYHRKVLKFKNVKRFEYYSSDEVYYHFLNELEDDSRVLRGGAGARRRGYGDCSHRGQEGAGEDGCAPCCRCDDGTLEYLQALQQVYRRDSTLGARKRRGKAGQTEDCALQPDRGADHRCFAALQFHAGDF